MFTIYRAATASSPVVYLLTAVPEADESICRLVIGRPFSLVSVAVPDWNADLSPWPAPRAFRKGEDFAGGADGFLHALISGALPQAEARLGFTPQRRMLAGYSLSGLFALYAMTKTDLFQAYASVSGALWYDGFLAYLGSVLPTLPPCPVYLSLGDLEARTKNARLAQVQSCTEQTLALFKNAGFPSTFELNPGNHFADYERRMAKALAWLLSRT